MGITTHRKSLKGINKVDMYVCEPDKYTNFSFPAPFMVGEGPIQEKKTFSHALEGCQPTSGEMNGCILGPCYLHGTLVSSARAIRKNSDFRELTVHWWRQEDYERHA